MLIICILVYSCDIENTEMNPCSDNGHEYVLKMYSINTSRNDMRNSFSVGDKLHIYFKGDIKEVATATYGEDSLWHVTLKNVLTNNDDGDCNVALIKGEELTPVNDHYVINSNTALYGTQDGRWEYYNDEISVYAQLKAQQVKIQFKSNKKTDIMIKGVQPQKNFSLISFSKWSYDDKDRPCYPQTIKINNKLSDGTYISDNYFCLGLGTNLYKSQENDAPGCQHYHYYNNTRVSDPCTIDGYIYIYDKQNTQKCYRRRIPADILPGSSLIINIPTPTSYDGWEMIDNEIQTINNEPRGVYIETGINNTCGFSINFSVKKDFPINDLNVMVGYDYIFRMIKQNDSWENYSGISFNNRTDAEIIVRGKIGDASDSPYNYFKNITYSHFPYYEELNEEFDDY